MRSTSLCLAFWIILVSTASAKDNNDSAVKALHKVLTRAVKGEFTSVIDGNGVSCDLRSGKLLIQPNHEGAFQRDGKTICGVRYDIAHRGKVLPQCVFGSVGIGDSKQDALETAAFEWLAAYGSPLIKCLNGGTPDIVNGKHEIYVSAMGIRGSKPGGWVDSSKEMHTKLLTAISWEKLENDKSISSVTINIVVNDKGGIEGECRVDGAISKDILLRLQKLEWPTTADGYMFKLAFVRREK